MADNKQAIIIKRIKKGGHGHHGGAWKVAYADFVTAMMAFFLLLWLLNSVTEEQLKGIADYFAPTAVSTSTSGAGGILGGQTVGEGAMQSRTTQPNFNMTLPPPTIGPGGEDLTEPKEGLNEQEFVEAMKQREEQQFQKAQEALSKALQSIPELQKFAQSLLVDNTPEGLRIQIVDQDGLAMFPSGNANMYGHTRAMLDLVARIIMQMPQKIAISGHTDATPFSSASNYTNWELSADRALASKRVLNGSGVPDNRVDRVIGRADVEPLEADNPTGPRNRRISIVLLRETKADAEGGDAKGGDAKGSGQGPSPANSPAPPAAPAAGGAMPAPVAPGGAKP